MPRISRAVAVGYPHHITQRGNYRQNVFETDADYKKYLEWLKEYSQKYLLNIWAYCLMSNHVHFIAIPMKEDSLAKTFNILHMRYSQYFNKRQNAKGHLWQGRFYSSALDRKHLYEAIRYVENNPVRAKIVASPSKYKWSSTHGHINKNADPILSNDCFILEQINDWTTYLAEDADPTIIDNIRQNTKTGRPCGEKTFVDKIGEILGRKLVALAKGRPRNEK